MLRFYTKVEQVNIYPQKFHQKPNSRQALSSVTGHPDPV